MKYCSKCGLENEEGVKYCSKCGNSLTGNNQKVNKEGLGIASLIIGIITLFFSFTCVLILPIFIIVPLAILGLILGIVNKVKHGKKFAGIILNTMAIIVSIIIFVFIIRVTEIAITPNTELNNIFNRIYNELEKETSDNYVSGIYNCKNFDGSKESSEYIVTFKLNDDYTFIWGKYNDLEKNYFKGTYTFEDEHKKNNSGDYSYYMLNLNVEDSMIDGIRQDISTGKIIKDEFGITSVNTKKQGVIMNVNTYNMYYCYEEK